MNIKRRIVLYISAITILAFAVTIIILSLEAKKAFIEGVYNGIDATASQSEENLHSKMQSAVRDAINISKTPALESFNTYMQFDLEEEAEVTRDEMYDFFVEFLERGAIYSRLTYIDEEEIAVVDVGKS